MSSSLNIICRLVSSAKFEHSTFTVEPSLNIQYSTKFGSFTALLKKENPIVFLSRFVSLELEVSLYKKSPSNPFFFPFTPKVNKFNLFFISYFYI